MNRPLVTVCFLLLGALAVSAAGLSTTITSVQSGRFPAIQVQVKVFSPQAVVLTKDDFTLTEEGSPVEEFTVTVAKPRQYYLLTMDRSSSIQADMPAIKQAVALFLKSLPPEVEVGVISFGSDVQLEHDFSRDRESLFAAVQKVRPWGGTALYDAIHDGAQRLLQAGGRTDQKTIVCLTDGVDSNPRGTGPMSQKTLPEVCQYASEHSVRIITIGLGKEIDDAALKSLADSTKGTYLRAPGVEDVRKAYVAISDRARLERYYGLEYTSPNPERDGKTRHLQIVSASQGMKGQGAGSYLAPSTPLPTPAPEAKPEPEQRSHGIPDRPLPVKPRLLGIGNRPLPAGLEPGYHWDGNKEEGVEILVHGPQVGVYQVTTFKDGQPNGPCGEWKYDGTPSGYHGTKVDGKWHGERICVRIQHLGDYELETFHHGVEHGPCGTWKIDGTPDGYHGTKDQGKWHGERVWIKRMSKEYSIDTFDHGVETGPSGSWKLEGPPHGYQGAKVNGKWHGQRIYIHPSFKDGFEVQTVDMDRRVGD